MRAMAALVVTLTLLLVGQVAEAQTLGEMTQNCEQLENYWRLYPPTKDSTLVPGEAGAAICFGYMQAVIGLTAMIGIPSVYLSKDRPNCGITTEGKVVGGPLCGHALGICLPKGVSYSQLLAVFLTYARSHAAEWHEAVGSHFALSWVNAFPCKDEYEYPAPAPR